MVVYFFLIVGVLVLSIGVYALSHPNLGHPVSEIEAPSGCSSGQILSWDGSSWECIDSVVSGSGFSGLEYISDIETPGNCPTDGAMNLFCPVGKVVIGGGCVVAVSSSLTQNFPHVVLFGEVYPRGWRCAWTGTPFTCQVHVICIDEP